MLLTNATEQLMCNYHTNYTNNNHYYSENKCILVHTLHTHVNGLVHTEINLR